MTETARAHGVEGAIPGALALAVGLIRGRRWSEDDGYADLVRRHGEARADEILDLGTEAAALLTDGAREWLRRTGLHTHPDFVQHVAALWRRRRSR